MTQNKPIPEGYWQDAAGNLVPESKIKDIDKLRHQTVTELCEAAKVRSAQLNYFKDNSMGDVSAFIETSLEQYGVKYGGNKGNVTLTSFDGRYQVVRQIQDRLSFDERLQAAKELIDECVVTWSAGVNDNIRALVNHAFQVDKEGKVSVSRILALRSIKISDPKWQKAMEAIADSMHAVGSKPYIRFYERNADGRYESINLDIARVS